MSYGFTLNYYLMIVFDQYDDIVYGNGGFLVDNQGT